MDFFPYLITLLILTSLLTIARYNVINNSINGAVISKRYSPIGVVNLIISYIIFITFSVFRKIDVGLGGMDAIGYKTIFNNAGGNLVDSLNRQFYEPGYAVLIWISRTISEDYRVALFIIYSIMFILMASYIKYINFNKYSFLSIFLLLTLWLSSFNITRVILALFLGTLVYTLLFRRKIKSALLIATLATTIHTAAVILFPIIVLVALIENRVKFKPKKLVFLIFLLTSFFLLAINIIDRIIIGTRYDVYLERAQGSMATGTYVIVAISFIISLFKFNNLNKFSSYNKTLIIILPVCLTLIPLQASISIVYRMVIFFLPILYILIPEIIRTFQLRSIKEVIENVPIKLGLFSYLIYRIYDFFSIEINHIGVPYINTLFN